MFAIDGATGRIHLAAKAANSAVFKNFGIVANRGLAYCGGKLFILQLDMKLVAMSPSDGEVLGEVAMSQDVPNATANYGYSQTSAPICANNTLVFGAAGSERGNRGFVMAYTPNLEAGVADAVLDDPARSHRVAARIADRRRRAGLDAGHDRRDDEHGLLRHRLRARPCTTRPSAPGRNPRTGSLIAVDLRDGPHEVVAAADPEHNQWEYDVAQPPLVYNDAGSAGRRGGSSRSRRRRACGSRSTRANGRPFHQRVKVIDRVEHPPLKPGQPVTIFPGSIGGLNYSPAAYDPKTDFVFNAAAETAGVLIQDRLSPTQKKRKLLLGDVYLGLAERQLRRSTRRAGRTTARSARSTSRRAAASGSSTRRSRSAAA